jgi:hypothetical protein
MLNDLTLASAGNSPQARTPIVGRQVVRTTIERADDGLPGTYNCTDHNFRIADYSGVDATFVNTSAFSQYQCRRPVESPYSISRPAKCRRSHRKDYPEFGFSAHHAGVALGSLY